jgi:hypothetical protein
VQPETNAHCSLDGLSITHSRKPSRKDWSGKGGSSKVKFKGHVYLWEMLDLVNIASAVTRTPRTSWTKDGEGWVPKRLLLEEWVLSKHKPSKIL